MLDKINASQEVIKAATNAGQEQFRVSQQKMKVTVSINQFSQK
jgi:hypothetical protein